ncbi:cytochrome c-type biogenesis protein [Wenzhouxiangella sediminis]|uniref:Cytochrome c-type biogenesis protein n=1 Tax=Wenzhouxiangella sediminis TaxID=1792836 RepID=A0A3E1KBP4_9GAMM|nr:cytochrome c-type biogenesis protein [Wenzhouxiangella sediminis]RFF32045.1 cytochrome c-type biogenesis protein CcmH [Wenzhouxiangella sediminis]
MKTRVQGSGFRFQGWLRVALAPLLALWLAAGAVASAIEPYEFESELQRQRFKALAEELRCTVCQNQSLADSDAPLAQDLRDEVFRMLQGNRSDQEIRNFMVERYGNYVLYRPPVAAHTLLLWGGPIVLLIIGLVAAVIVIRKRRSAL